MKLDMRLTKLVETDATEMLGGCRPFLEKMEASVEHLGSKRVWIAGGFIRDTLLGAPAKDIDVCVSISDATPYLKGCLVNQGFREVQESPWHFGFARDDGSRVDILRTVFGNPRLCVRSFDFICCAAAAYLNGGRIILVRHEDFEADCRARRLRLNAPRYPRSSLARVKRFVLRGWTIAPDELLRLEGMALARYRPEVVLTSM